MLTFSAPVTACVESSVFNGDPVEQMKLKIICVFSVIHFFAIWYKLVKKIKRKTHV